MPKFTMKYRPPAEIELEAHEVARDDLLRAQRSSATPMTDNRVDALTISAAVLTQAGRHWRSACGTDERSG